MDVVSKKGEILKVPNADSLRSMTASEHNHAIFQMQVKRMSVHLDRAEMAKRSNGYVGSIDFTYEFDPTWMEDATHHRDYSREYCSGILRNIRNILILEESGTANFSIRFLYIKTGNEWVLNGYGFPTKGIRDTHRICVNCTISVPEKWNHEGYSANRFAICLA